MRYVRAAKPLGMESGVITDSQITASSEFNANHGAIYARLKGSPHGKSWAWCADAKQPNPYITIDLGTDCTVLS